MINQVKKIIGVAAGKGGVGKSTVAVNLALALKEQGFSVGILDADIYGPSLVKMLPPDSLPKRSEEGIFPGKSHGLLYISMGFFTAQATIVRAPIANQIIHQFLKEVVWEDLDFLIVDFPPGTGDIQLSLLQEANFSSVVIVTTPQEISLIDVEKTIEMIQKAAVPIYGIIENMSYFEEEGGKRHYLFGQKGGERLSQAFRLPLLVEIPIDPVLGRCSDRGQSPFEQASVSIGLFLELAEKITGSLEGITEVIHVSLFEGLKVEWRDGFIRTYKGEEIQMYCPCVLCRDRIYKDGNDAVEITQMTPVGKYGLKLQFSSGCSNGIYPFSMLRKLCLV